MAKNPQTASFLVRFNQKLFKDDNGEDQIQWRGNVKHIQSGEEHNFVELQKMLLFLQEKMSDVTIEATKGKTKEEQDGILSKSFGIWKKAVFNGPKFVLETIKDPKLQVENIQNQLTQVGEALQTKVDLDAWKSPNKNDARDLLEMMQKMDAKIDRLSKKLDKLNS